MALTPEQRAKLQALTSGQQTAPSGQPSVLTADQRARLGASQPAQIAPVMTPQKPEGLISRAASFVNRGVEKFANLPGVKQVGQATGAAIGGAGAVIGGAVAANLTPVMNIARGRPVFENYGEQIKRTAAATGRFGFQLGEQAPTLAAMQTLGRAPNLVLGGAQTIEGYNQTREALDRGDTGAAIEAGITTGIGAVGTVLGLRQKGFLVDEGFSTGVKARARGMSVDEFNTRKYEAVMQDVLQPNKSTVKRETKGILAQARKERAGMSVEPQKTTARVLVEEGVVPGTIDEGGTTKFRTADQVVDMDNRVAYANDELEKALALDPNPQFDLEAKKAEAVRSVDDIQNVSATEKKAMKAEIERFFDDEIETRGQFVDGSQYNQIKRGFANAGDYKNLTPGQRHMRQVAESIAKDIEARYADKFNVKEVNRTIGDYIRARNELQALDGSVVKGGGLSRRLAQLAGTVAAGPLSSIPLVDNIIGGYLAGKAQQYAVSPARKLAGLESADIPSPGPNVLAAAQEGSQAAAARQAALPRLPAPRSPLPDALEQYTPSRPGLASQAEARTNIQGTLMDPTRVRTDEVVQMPGAQRPTVTPRLPPPKGTIPDPLAQYNPSPARVLSQSEARAELGLDRARPDVAIPMAEPKRTVDLPTPKEVTQIRRVEAVMLQQQLDSFRYATPEMESGYQAFKNLASRSKAALDESLDADGFVKKYGKAKADSVIEGAASGGDMTNNELLDAYRIRYRTEQSVKAQIERMKKGQP